ncbi:MAG: hypothetical protein KKG42_05440, partial [Gammaproteobacteria bacterium]|nr:hypothetical protein [Gammaproteobacteria bacterium]
RNPSSVRDSANEQGHCSKPPNRCADRPDNDNAVSLATNPREQVALPLLGSVDSSEALASYQEPPLSAVPATRDEVQIFACC